MPTIKVFLADDHTMVRQGLCSVLASSPDIKVIGEAGDGQEALRKLRSIHPDVAIIDITMDNLNGLEVARRISKSYPETKVLILSIHSQEEYVTEAFKLGASGYLVKDAAVEELIAAIKAVHKGQVFISTRIGKLLVQDYVEKAKALDAEGLGPRLTSRETEVLQLIAEGRCNSEIASLLNISAKTVSTHRAHIMKKLDIHDAVGLVKYAIRKGLVQIDF
jgi:DNA-binding NarL/FixJ family response regulator